MTERLIYVAACLVAPLVWGVFAVTATRWIERKFPKPNPVEERPTGDIDYHI